jgi:ketosteroid isomerase-like protein
MSDAERIALIAKLFEEFNESRTVEFMLAHVADDVRFRLTVGAGTPFSGDFVGQDGIRRYFAAYEEELETPEHIVTDILAGGEKVVVLGSESQLVKRTARLHTGLDWVTVFTFRGEEIADILVVENTAYLTEAPSR